MSVRILVTNVKQTNQNKNNSDNVSDILNVHNALGGYAQEL